MKFAIVILLVLGVLAGGAAAVLFQWVQTEKMRGSLQAAIADVVLAQADLPARTRLTADHVKAERVPRTGLPAGVFSNPAQAIGKTLKVAVSKGQPLTAAHVLPETAIDDLLRPGMLAFQISLARRSTAADLLYPGCIVDVFATFPLQDHKKGEAVTTPLLQNIQVLAVRDQTVVSAAEEKDNQKKSSTSTKSPLARGGDMTVALEVTARQAAALQLAMERGTLGLAMRNPLDKNLNPTDPMVVKEGQLTASSEAMDAQTLTLVSQLQTLLGNKPPADANCPPAANPVAKAAPDPDALASVADPAESLSSKRSAWQMTIIRGQKVEEAEIKLKDEQRADTPPADANQAPADAK